MKKIILFLAVFLILASVMTVSIFANPIFTTPVKAYKTSQAPVIDGVYSETEGWGDPIATLDFEALKSLIVLNTGDHPEYMTDEELVPSLLTIYVRWDDQYFYYCAVSHQNHVNPYTNDIDIWKGDSILFNIIAQEHDDSDKTRVPFGLSDDGNLYFYLEQTESNTYGCQNIDDWRITWDAANKVMTYEVLFAWQDISPDEKPCTFCLRDLLMPNRFTDVENPIDISPAGLKDGTSKMYWEFELVEESADSVETIYKDYASAADGDLLYIADFRGDDVYQPHIFGETEGGVIYTPEDNGRRIHMQSVEGWNAMNFYYGGKIGDLKADKTTAYTLYYKVKINGQVGKNNSIGVGGFGWYNPDEISKDEYYHTFVFMYYGNFNSEWPVGEESPNRGALDLYDDKEYNNEIENAIADNDGYLTCRIDFDGPNNKVSAYAITADGWTLMQEREMYIGEHKYLEDGVDPDTQEVGIFLYNYYDVIDADVKDVKWFKGVNLTAEQLEATGSVNADYFAPYASKAPVIDGVIDDMWSAAEEIVPAEIHDRDEMASGYVKIMWRPDAMYFLEVAQDSALPDPADQSDESLDFSANSFDLWISEKNTQTYDYESDPGDYHICVNSNGVKCPYTGNLAVYDEIEYAVTTSADGYIVEIRVPYLAIDPAEEGHIMGFNVSLNDDVDNDYVRDAYSTWMEQEGHDDYYWRSTFLNTVAFGAIPGDAATEESATPSSDTTSTYKDYASAADGDLLYIADFRGDDVYQPHIFGETEGGVIYTPEDNGRRLHMQSVEGWSTMNFYYGGKVGDLKADKTTTYTLYYKVKINGQVGKNNSIGVGGFGWYNPDEIVKDEYYHTFVFMYYGNYNSEWPVGEESPNRGALDLYDDKEYNNEIENAIADNDGYLTCRIDFDGPNNKVSAYAITASGWTLMQEREMYIGEHKYLEDGVDPDTQEVGIFLYNYYDVIDADVKDVKWFKGVNLKAEQLEATAEEPAAPVQVELSSKGLTTIEDAADSKNIITSYEFVSGTDSFGGEGPENLWDGETTTKFCTNVFPAESIVKLDGVYNVTGFAMATANDNADYNGRSPNAWTISVSKDGENWTKLASGDDTFFEETNFTYYAGEGSADGVQYVKFNADSTASGTFQVSEVTLFGDKTVDAPVDEALDNKAEAPNTFDFGVMAAVAAVISLGGFVVSKKRK